MHQVDRRLSRYGETSAAKPAFGGLELGGVLCEPGMLAKALLDLLPKLRYQLAVTRAARCYGGRDIWQQSLQVCEQRGECSAQRQAPARSRSAELAQQHLGQGSQVRLAQSGAIQRYGGASLVEYYRCGSETLLDEYSPRALARVWKAARFSWWFTTLMHKLSDDPLARKLQLAELEYLCDSDAACRVVAENYAGLPWPRR